MASLKSRPCRTLLQLLAFMSGFRHGHALVQSYCSSQNTGSDYSAVTNIYQSNGACHDECAANYAFAVVQWQQCWCSNYAPASQLSVSDCNASCPGYPDEKCGDADKGLYGYIALNKSPSGTAGGKSSAAPSTSTQQQQTSSQLVSSTTTEISSSKPSENTVYSSISVTVFSTVQQSPSVVVSYVTLTSSKRPSSVKSSPSIPSSTSITSTTSTNTPSSTFIPITSTTENAAVATQDAPTSAESSIHTTLVSTRVITISGAPVTQTVTSTPIVPNPNAAGQIQEPQRKSVSSGTIAGAVVGSILGVALLILGAFFLWRRRRRSDVDETRSTMSSSARRKMERNTSVLSKTGLLSSAGAAPHDVEKSSFNDGPVFISTNNKRASAMLGSTSSGPSPVSPVGAGAFNDSSQRSRRDSRPLVYDQRLNPNAIMQNWGANGSRTSVGTMQDQRDYSRPLGVTNPDPVDN